MVNGNLAMIASETRDRGMDLQFDPYDKLRACSLFPGVTVRPEVARREGVEPPWSRKGAGRLRGQK